MSRPRSATIDDKDKPPAPQLAESPVDMTKSSSKPFPSTETQEPHEPQQKKEHLQKHEHRHFELPLAGNVVGASTSSGHHPLIAAFSSMMRPIVDKTHPSQENFHLCIRLFNQTSFDLVFGDAFHCGGEFYQGAPKYGHVVGPGESNAFEVRAKSYPFWSGGCQGGLQLALAEGDKEITGFAMGWSAPPIGAYRAGFSAHHDAKAGRSAARSWGRDESSVTILTAEHNGHLEVFHLVATPGQHAAYQVIQMPPLGAVHISEAGEKITGRGGANACEGGTQLGQEIKGFGDRLGETTGSAGGGKEGHKATGSEGQDEDKHQDEEKHTHRPESRQSEDNVSESPQQKQKQTYSGPQIVKQPVALPQKRLQLQRSSEELRQDPTAAAEQETTSAQRNSSSSDQARDKARRLRRGDKPQAATPASA